MRWGWRRVGGDRNEDKEDTSEISVVLYKLNSIEMLMLARFKRGLMVEYTGSDESFEVMHNGK